MTVHDASSLLHAKQLAGSEVTRRGRATSIPGLGGGAGYLAVSKKEVVLVKMRSSILNMKLSDEVLARALRKEIASVEFDRGTLAVHLTIVFRNDDVWEFAVKGADKKMLARVAQVLGAEV